MLKIVAADAADDRRIFVAEELRFRLPDAPPKPSYTVHAQY